MNDREPIRMSLTTFLLLIVGMLVFIMGVYIYRLNKIVKQTDNKTDKLEEQIDFFEKIQN